MSVQRRPRIPDDLAAAIDKARGRVPFESWVREALYDHLTFFCERPRGEREGMTYGGGLLTELLCSDVFQLDLKEFDTAVTEARAYVVAELDQQAVEDEHMETF